MRSRIALVGLVAVIVAAAIAFAAKHVELSNDVRTVAPRPYDVVTVRWRLRDLTTAQHSGRICVDAGSRGHVCTRFTAGERPADALIRMLARDNVRVRSG